MNTFHKLFYADKTNTDLTFQFGDVARKTHKLIVNKFIKPAITNDIVHFDVADDDLIEMFMRIIYQDEFNNDDLLDLLTVQPFLVQIGYYGPINISVSLPHLLACPSNNADKNNLYCLTNRLTNIQSHDKRFTLSDEYIHDAIDPDFNLAQVNNCIAISNEDMVLCTSNDRLSASIYQLANQTMKLLHTIIQKRPITSAEFLDCGFVVLYQSDFGILYNMCTDQITKLTKHTKVSYNPFTIWSTQKQVLYKAGYRTGNQFHWTNTYNCSNSRQMVPDHHGRKLYYTYKHKLMCFSCGEYTINVLAVNIEELDRCGLKYVIMKKGYVFDLSDGQIFDLSDHQLQYSEQVIAACIKWTPDWQLIGKVMNTCNLQQLFGGLSEDTTILFQKILTSQTCYFTNIWAKPTFLNSMQACLKLIERWSIPVVPILAPCANKVLLTSQKILHTYCKLPALIKALFSHVKIAIQQTPCNTIQVFRLPSVLLFINHSEPNHSCIMFVEPTALSPTGEYIYYDGGLVHMSNKHEQIAKYDIHIWSSVKWLDDCFQYTIGDQPIYRKLVDY